MRVNFQVPPPADLRPPRPGRGLRQAMLAPLRGAAVPRTASNRRVAPPCRKAAHASLPLLRAALAAGLLMAAAGCSTMDPQRLKAWTIEPVMDVKHAMSSSAAYYTPGRYYDGMQSWDKAIDAYRKSVEADPRNVEAHNALGVALARAGRYVDAEVALRTALSIAPRSAHVHSNLGQVLMLTARPQEAVQELKSAVLLDRDNPVATANLREALEQRDATTEEAPVALAPIAAVTPSVQPLVAEAPTARAAQAPAVLMRVDDRATLAAFASGNVPAAAVEVAPSSAKAAPQSRAVRLELSNGNGVPGLAARLGRWMARHSVPVQRLTNQRPFLQERTVLQYRDGLQEAAQRIGRSLPMPARIEAAPTEGLHSDVRVVIGRDWIQAARCMDEGACPRASTVVAERAD
jgi:tetratricopeptide (TPR) repeat protein